MGYTVAVLGATGAVGREILNILAEREFPADAVYALASGRSHGKRVTYGEDSELSIQDVAEFDFRGVDIVLSSSGSKVSAEYAPKAAEAGAVVIDNTSHFRMEPDVPLIVPEVNPGALAGYTKRGIVANPNCSTIQMVLALKPLHELASIRRVVVSTYQATSGSGKAAMDELFNQTRGIYMNEPAQPQEYPKQIAFNAIPHIDSFMDDGATKEEWKMVNETRKILDPDVRVAPTCVRIATFIGHGESLNVEFEEEIGESESAEALREFPGISLVDYREDGGYVTPYECAGEDAVFVSRLRTDPTVDSGLAFWCVSDNLRKGAALNSVQIAELLVEQHLR